MTGMKVVRKSDTTKRSQYSPMRAKAVWELCTASTVSLFPISVPFHGRLSQAHIFIKETVGIVWFTIKLLRTRNIYRQNINIVTDNSAAYFACQNLYSSNECANRWVRALHRELEARGCSKRELESRECSWGFTLVISEDNPADGPSRWDNCICPKRLRAGHKAVAEARKGVLYSVVSARFLRNCRQTF